MGAARSYRPGGIVAAALVLAGCEAAAPPRPVSGAVPLALSELSSAKGADLRLDDGTATGGLSLVGKRARTTGKIVEVTTTDAGETVIGLDAGSGPALFRFPSTLENAERLRASPDAEWELIGRLDREVTLADGRRAVALAPDAIIKTPGPPGMLRSTDVVVEIGAAEYFGVPAISPFEARAPTTSLRVDPGTGSSLAFDYVIPGPTALAAAPDEQGRRFLDYRSIRKAADGRSRTSRCVFRVDGDRLVNVGYGYVDTAPDGQAIDQRWTVLDGGKLVDGVTGKRSERPLNSYGQPCMEFVLSGFPTTGPRAVRFYLASEWGESVAAYASQDGEETLTIAGEPIRARRVRTGMEVRRTARQADLPEHMLRHAEAVGETLYGGDGMWWIAVDPPHRVLKYVGPLGPPGAPSGTVERIR